MSSGLSSVVFFCGSDFSLLCRKNKPVVTSAPPFFVLNATKKKNFLWVFRLFPCLNPKHMLTITQTAKSRHSTMVSPPPPTPSEPFAFSLLGRLVQSFPPFPTPSSKPRVTNQIIQHCKTEKMQEPGSPRLVLSFPLFSNASSKPRVTNQIIQHCNTEKMQEPGSPLSSPTSRL